MSKGRNYHLDPEMWKAESERAAKLVGAIKQEEAAGILGCRTLFGLERSTDETRLAGVRLVASEAISPNAAVMVGGDGKDCRELADLRARLGREPTAQEAGEAFWPGRVVVTNETDPDCPPDRRQAGQRQPPGRVQARAGRHGGRARHRRRGRAAGVVLRAGEGQAGQVLRDNRGGIAAAWLNGKVRRTG